MDVKKDQKQHEYSSEKSLQRYGNEMLKDKMKKAIIKKIIAVITAKAAVIGGIIAASLGALLFLVGADYINNEDTEKTTNAAKAQAITTSYNKDASITGTDENGNEINRIIVTTNSNKTGYEIAYNNDPEYLESIREDLAELDKASDYTDYELAVIGALMENGANLDMISEDGLKCLAAFVKAESCTQNLDLRPNSEKQSGKNVGDYIEKYEPAKMEDLSENGVPGVILVQRTNTNGTKTTLEYKIKSDFDQLVANDNGDARNYFTINESGNLIIAKWDHELINVTGDYPESLNESEKDIATSPEGKYIIKTDEFDYREYIAKHVMPFELLVQLLVTTEEPEFCMDLVECALNSKIVIDIQEEETVTTIEKERIFTVHSKDEKYVDYQIIAAEQGIVNEKNILLNYAKDDLNKDCTNYSKEVMDPVTVVRTFTSHSYKFEIIEVDNWMAHYQKKYDYTNINPIKEPPEGQDPVPIVTENKGKEYVQIETETPQPVTDGNTINSDENVKKFVNETVANYEPKITVPEGLKMTSGTDNQGKFKKIDLVKEDGTIEQVVGLLGRDIVYPEARTIYREIEDGVYILPTLINVITKKVNSTNTTKEIPQIKYTYEINDNETGYNLITNIDPLVTCKVSRLNIKEFERLDEKTTITTTTTKYPTDDNPVTTTDQYGINAQTGDFEKFLLAYDNSEAAQEQLNSIDSWLYGMMEDNVFTTELVNVIKDLLKMYDEGKTIELDLSYFFNSGSLTPISTTNGTGWWWPVGGSKRDASGKFTEGDPTCKYISSYFGPREAPTEGASTNHQAIDIAGNGDIYIIAAMGGEVSHTGWIEGYGYTVKIKHSNGMISRYSHMREKIEVTVGEQVEQGQILGLMGNSGISTGQHLDFGIYDASGTAIDPLTYVDPERPRPQAIGGISAQLYDFILAFEGGAQYFDGTYYTVFNNGIDNNLELTCGVAIGTLNGETYGSVKNIFGRDVKVGDKLTVEEYSKIFEQTAQSKMQIVDSAITKTGVVLNQQQKDAVYSLCWNASNASKTIQDALNKYKAEGDKGYWEYIHSYTRSGDSRPKGLVRRRAEEFEMFRTGDYAVSGVDEGVNKHRSYNKEFGFNEFAGE